MATISAALRHLHITSGEPARLADFYAQAYALQAAEADGIWHCRAAERHVAVSAGPANKLRYALFGFTSTNAFADFRARLAGRPLAPIPPGCGLAADAIAIADPDDNLIVFEGPQDRSQVPGVLHLEGHLQHFAFRTPDIVRMATFYEDVLGFVVSDRVVDDAGQLRACFMRVGPLHHSLALFAAPVSCYDHQSFEAPDWASLKEWADHMGRLKETIVWGIGRHGPGNDVFFMVRDPDGNLAEVSAEIESCAENRPAGTWPHEERTLNLWGKAIMRS